MLYPIELRAQGAASVGDLRRQATSGNAQPVNADGQTRSQIRIHTGNITRVDTVVRVVVEVDVA